MLHVEYISAKKKKKTFSLCNHTLIHSFFYMVPFLVMLQSLLSGVTLESYL